jgi:oligopeptide/dipeptide ABC transporter ATP-binding protein
MSGEAAPALTAVSAVPPVARSDGAPVLRVEDLTTRFRNREGDVTAVRAVSLELAGGQKLGIVGESGSGKSALALSILGLIEPPGEIVGGSVAVNGREISRLSDGEMSAVRGREISLIFQDPTAALNPVKTIGSQISEVLRQHQAASSKKAIQQRVLELLNDVEIPRAADRIESYPHELSGGMRQRIMIAIALANDPSVVIADEPTSSLDVTTQAQILELLNRLVTEHETAVILITHNLGIVAEFCDDVHVMYAGRLVERAPVRSIFRHPVHPYTRALLGAVVRLDDRSQGPLPAIGGEAADLAHLPAGCAFEPRCPVGAGRDICREVAPPPMTVAADGATVLSECHFANELASDTRE